MRRTELDERLSSAAKYVRQGAVFADIGTDHAYLPLFLLERGVIDHAYAADIAEGPLARARRAVMEGGRSEQVTLLLANGLEGMENLGLTDIAVCGMGGETVVEILRAAPFVKNENVRLILQPMSRAGVLRRYLAEEGFCIEEETLVVAASKRYACLCAVYDGAPRTLDRAACELGEYNLRNPNGIFIEMLKQAYRVQEKKVRGIRAGGAENEEEEDYLCTLARIVAEYDG